MSFHCQPWRNEVIGKVKFKWQVCNLNGVDFVTSSASGNFHRNSRQERISWFKVREQREWDRGNIFGNLYIGLTTGYRGGRT